MVKNYNKYQQKSNNLKSKGATERKPERGTERKLERFTEQGKSCNNQSVEEETQQNTERKLERSYKPKVGTFTEPLKQYNNNKQENQLTADESKASRQADFISWFNGKVQNAKIPKIRLFTENREKSRGAGLDAVWCRQRERSGEPCRYKSISQRRRQKTFRGDIRLDIQT
jgi:hypothetical protein